MGRTKDSFGLEILILLFLTLCTPSNSAELVLRPVGSEYQPISTNSEGCNFGFLHYNIGDSWHPDITPFGVMFCVICTCDKVSDTETTGKVTCRNIRHRCPATACARPKVEQGHCCPSCPDEFISLLTTPKASISRQNGLGRAHFSLVRSTLSISIRYEGPRKLRMASFMDSKGSLLKEINIQRKSINGSQVCLVWNQMNNKQIESFKQGKVSLALKLKKQHAAGLKGDIVLYKSYSEESFEALLSSDDETSSALASFNFARSGKLLRIYLRYSGSHSLGSGTQVTIKLIKNPTNSKGARVVKVISASQVKRENSDFKTVWSNPAEHALKWLSRGHLNITVILNTADQTTKLTGRIGIKRTCNTIVSQLSGRDAPRPTMTGASGYASFEFANNGQIHYQIFLSGLMNSVTEISLQATSRRQNVKRLSRSVTADEHGQAEVKGVWERPSFKDICWLFSGNTFINVRTTANKNGEIHGQLKQFPYRGHHLSYHDPPVLLSGNEVVPRIQTGAAGQAWFSLDKNCALHYHLMFSGMDRGRKNLMTAELQGFADYGEVPQPYDEHVHFLRSFEGETVSGSARNLDSAFLSNLVRGLVYLQVSSEEVPQGELRSQVLVNSDICRKRFPDLQQGGPMHGSCYHDDKEYFNGQTWVSEDDKCSSCTCQDSEIVCAPLQCQRLNCSEAPILLPHLCCPVCPAVEEKVVIYYEKKNRPSMKGCYVKRDRKVYPAGAVWHPFVQPFGYMRCHACTCLAKSEDISCTKVKCPDLHCKYPIKLRLTDCCMRCPDEEDGQSDDDKAVKKGCNFRGSEYKDGQTWKPYFPLFGPSRCITCKCENGKTTCKHATCPKGQCRNSIGGAMKSCCVPCSGS
ncbi:hypothetical protein ACROYT_G023934 [Oculina patagonica]